jgi:hypothetical protein
MAFCSPTANLLAAPISGSIPTNIVAGEGLVAALLQWSYQGTRDSDSRSSDSGPLSLDATDLAGADGSGRTRGRGEAQDAGASSYADGAFLHHCDGLPTAFERQPRKRPCRRAKGELGTRSPARHRLPPPRCVCAGASARAKFRW